MILSECCGCRNIAKLPENSRSGGLPAPFFVQTTVVDFGAFSTGIRRNQVILSDQHWPASISSIGDIDHDGYDDFMLSATDHKKSHGTSFSDDIQLQPQGIDQPNGVSLLVSSDQVYFGFSIGKAPGGDINMDGIDDFFVLSFKGKTDSEYYASFYSAELYVIYGNKQRFANSGIIINDAYFTSDVNNGFVVTHSADFINTITSCTKVISEKLTSCFLIATSSGDIDFLVLFDDINKVLHSSLSSSQLPAL